MHVDEETDINRVVEYFSYEHFYVLYCKFFELDVDKDSKLTRADLVRYGEHSLSDAIVDRIFQVGTKVFSDGQVGGFEESGMSYPDFIFFMLSEEDKSSEVALRYWFSCCDLDGDGALSPEEMRHFYKNQILRVTGLGQESIQVYRYR
jgi:serine/threonine-protein phosphatase 2A regulatory subunit B''